MTKEEKITEAWGEYWNQLNDVQKTWALENYGATFSVSSELYIKLKKSKLFELQPCYPKSLKGIENNNGWIKIESEADLPKEKTLCFGIYEDLTITNYFFNPEKDFDRLLFLEEFTHYQPIVQPKPPIY